MTPAQVVLSWNAQRNIIVIPKSVTPSRIEENLKINELSKEDFDKISSITIRQRGVNHKSVQHLNIFPDFNKNSLVFRLPLHKTTKSNELDKIFKARLIQDF